MAIKFSKNLARWQRDKVRERKQRHDRALDRRNFMVELLGGKCRVCGTSEGKLWFEYVGKHKRTAQDNMSSLLSCNINRLMAAAPNHKLLCQKHWWEKFYKDRNIGGKKHGTVSMYSNRMSKCRCDKCRAAWNEYSKKWHKKRRDNKRAALLLLKQGKLKVLSNPS